ncbi:hypothetical protein LWI28_005801 [Acer negundo]|uniref:Uncharacterized protein n=1 Tax=Acer negundo TaxID=4023 RepID=A0AAD5NTU9_ACENE|nr:hypothetical protein LWI28_005801 [Acer negundo]
MMFNRILARSRKRNGAHHFETHTHTKERKKILFDIPNQTYGLFFIFPFSLLYIFHTLSLIYPLCVSSPTAAKYPQFKDASVSFSTIPITTLSLFSEFGDAA